MSYYAITIAESGRGLYHFSEADPHYRVALPACRTDADQKILFQLERDPQKVYQRFILRDPEERCKECAKRAKVVVNEWARQKVDEWKRATSHVSTLPSG